MRASWKYKILVVDDEPDLERLMLQRMRRDIRAGLYKFVFAHNGVEALDRLKEQPDIDLVLSDINMPKMDGLTLIEQIPKVQPDIRSVIISAYGDMKNIRTAMNRGAFDFVTKPIDFDDLRLTISRTLQHLVEWREALESRDKLVALQNELGVASKIQQSILPTRFPDRPGCRIFANMKPARNVGGDFFDVIHLADGRIGIAIADVSDKGVPAALFMMSCRTLIKGAAIGKTNPGEVLHEVNQLLQEDNDAAMFVTVFYGVYDPDSQQFHYANGGHNSPLVVHADGSSAELPLTGGIALGLIPDLDYDNNTVTLSRGDMIVLYTDGVTEAFDEQGNQFGTGRLQEVFAGTEPTDVQDANRSVFEAVEKFAGDTPQSDDITCVTLLHGSDGG
jgi:sigma-B regulation protein RsbU (phosphoserine phosphatase)